LKKKRERRTKEKATKKKKEKIDLRAILSLLRLLNVFRLVDVVVSSSEKGCS